MPQADLTEDIQAETPEQMIVRLQAESDAKLAPHEVTQACVEILLKLRKRISTSLPRPIPPNLYRTESDYIRFCAQIDELLDDLGAD